VGCRDVEWLNARRPPDRRSKENLVMGLERRNSLATFVTTRWGDEEFVHAVVGSGREMPVCAAIQRTIPTVDDGL
jgi:hypothetical protein